MLEDPADQAEEKIENRAEKKELHNGHAGVSSCCRFPVWEIDLMWEGSEYRRILVKMCLAKDVLNGNRDNHQH